MKSPIPSYPIMVQNLTAMSLRVLGRPLDQESLLIGCTTSDQWAGQGSEQGDQAQLEGEA